MLNSQIPLIDLRVASRARVQITRVPKAPLRQFAVLGSLRRRQASRKWAFTTSSLDGRRPKTGGLVIKIILGEEHGCRLRKRRAGILEIRGDVHPVEHSRAAPQHSIGGELIGEPESRSPIVPVHRRVAPRRTCKCRDALDIPNLPKLRKLSGAIAIYRNADARVCSEVIELQPIETLAVGRAPFVAQTDVDRQFGRNL